MKKIIFVIALTLAFQSAGFADLESYKKSLNRANKAQAWSNAAENLRIKQMVNQGQMTPYEGEILMLERKRQQSDERAARSSAFQFQESKTRYRLDEGMNCTSQEDYLGRIKTSCI